MPSLFNNPLFVILGPLSLPECSGRSLEALIIWKEMIAQYFDFSLTTCNLVNVDNNEFSATMWGRTIWMWWKVYPKDLALWWKVALLWWVWRSRMSRWEYNQIVRYSKNGNINDQSNITEPAPLIMRLHGWNWLIVIHDLPSANEGRYRLNSLDLTLKLCCGPSC